MKRVLLLFVIFHSLGLFAQELIINPNIQKVEVKRIPKSYKVDVIIDGAKLVTIQPCRSCSEINEFISELSTAKALKKLLKVNVSSNLSTNTYWIKGEVIDPPTPKKNNSPRILELQAELLTCQQNLLNYFTGINSDEAVKSIEDSKSNIQRAVSTDSIVQIE